MSKEENLETIDKNLKQSVRPKADYVGEDGLLYCGKCRTKKQFRCDAGHFAGRILNCACECQTKAYEREQEELRKQWHDERVRELREAGIGDESYKRMTFDTDDGAGDRAAMNTAALYVEHWDVMRDENIGLVFSGETGNGKTFLASCIVNALIEREIPAMITTVPALITAMSADYEERKPEILWQIGAVDLLVLDDVGVERKTGYAIEKLFEIVDARYRSGKPLIITTNLSLTALRKPSELEYKRVYDRVLEMCQPVSVRGGSRRDEIAKSKSAIARKFLCGDNK